MAKRYAVQIGEYGIEFATQDGKKLFLDALGMATGVVRVSTSAYNEDTHRYDPRGGLQFSFYERDDQAFGWNCRGGCHTILPDDFPVSAWSEVEGFGSGKKVVAKTGRICESCKAKEQTKTQQLVQEQEEKAKAAEADD